MKKPQSFLVEDAGRCKRSTRGFTSFVNPFPQTDDSSIDFSSSDAKGLQRRGAGSDEQRLGVESGLRCLTHGAPRKSSILPSPARAGLC